MGRKKSGKPGRRRTGSYTLQQLQPPGYDEWIKIDSDFTATAAINDPRLGEEAIDLMQRFARLRPLYRGPIPMQAVRLDMALDMGTIPISTGGENASLIPVKEVATALGVDSTGGDIRDSFHRLHAVGAILIEYVEDDVPLIRIVSQPPARPGDPWIFHGSAEDMLVPKTCIPAQPGDLALDEFAALAFIRVHMSKGTEASPEEFAEHEGIGTAERARKLFAAVAELAKVKGCSACPSAHVCTRPETAGAAR